ncbi:tyrosine-type recombinase/integrase [Cytobacillus sp. FJAT-54145]|uniref:Tyrosine-type recombinase/integrase n=1 Tax=Cytobacillus spartinae TaxID=3299023 RepID=A0ABW6K9T8_9BACI
MFSTWMKNRELSSGTQQEYLYNVRRFLVFLKEMSFGEATKLEVMEFLTEEREKHQNTASTRNRKLMAIRAFYRALNDLNVYTGNPAKEVDAAKTVKEKLPTYLDRKAWLAFLESVPNSPFEIRDKGMFRLMVEAGLRVSEVQKMNTTHLDRENSGIHVTGKGNKQRFIPISPSLMSFLQLVIDQRIPPKPSDPYALFVSRNGTRITRRRIQQIAEGIFEKLPAMEGLEHLEGLGLSCHKLRHTFGTNLMRSGADLRTAQELMGHESPATTQIYTHVNNEQKRNAIDQLHSFLNSSDD